RRAERAGADGAVQQRVPHPRVAGDLESETDMEPDDGREKGPVLDGRSQAGRIGEAMGLIHGVAVEVDFTAPEADGIGADEAADLGIVVARAVVVEAGGGIPLAPGETEGPGGLRHAAG